MNYDHDYCSPDYSPVRKTPKMIQAADISGLDVKTSERAGADQRARAIAHVEELLSGEFLTGEEAGKRVNHIKNAETVSQVNAALTDLPAMPAPRHFDWGNPRHVYSVLGAALALFVSLIVVGGVIVGHTTMIAPEIFGGIMLGIGTVGAVFSFVTTIFKTVMFLDD